MDGVADDDVLNAARALGSMRNVGTSSKEPAFDGVDLNASHDTRMRGYHSQTGEMCPEKSVEPVPMLRWHLQRHRAPPLPCHLEPLRRRGPWHQNQRCSRRPRMMISS